MNNFSPRATDPKNKATLYLPVLIFSIVDLAFTIYSMNIYDKERFNITNKDPFLPNVERKKKIQRKI